MISKESEKEDMKIKNLFYKLKNSPHMSGLFFKLAIPLPL